MQGGAGCFWFFSFFFFVYIYGLFFDGMGFYHVQKIEC